MTSGPGTRIAGPALLLAAILASMVYVPALSGAFVSDDAALVAGNPAIRSWGRALASFERSYWDGLKEVHPYYRPFPILSYALDHAVGGAAPFAYHVTNLALHAGCALLVGLLVLGLARQGPISGAWIAGASFALALAAVHPLHSEPVAAIYGRPDLLAAFFTLAALNFAVRGRVAPALLCLVPALLSKESALGIPFLLPFAMGFGAPGKRRSPHRLLFLRFALALGILAGYLALRANAVGLFVDEKAYTLLDNPLVQADGAGRFMTPVAVLGRYAALWLAPVRLCADRGFDTVPLVASFADPWFLAGAGILSLGILGTLILLRSRSSWALPLAAAGVTYLPASNLILMAPALMAERFVYLPSLFVCVLIGAAFARLLGVPSSGTAAAAELDGKRSGLLRRWAFSAAAAAILIAAAARTWARAGEFRDDLTLYASNAASCPLSAKAQYNLGNALSRERRDYEAIEAFRAAVAVAPWMAVAHNNLGMSLVSLGEYREAEEAFRGAVEQAPRLLSPHESLAGLLYLDGRLEAARDEATIALSLRPDPMDTAQLEDLIRKIDGRLKPGP